MRDGKPLTRVEIVDRSQCDPLYDPRTGSTDGDDVRHHCGCTTFEDATGPDDSEPVIDWTWVYE